MTELTPKEQEIVDYLITGKSNKQIAEEFGISVNTVKSHLKSVYQKMEVNSRQQLLVLKLSTDRS